jgi:hypothetical protein
MHILVGGAEVHGSGGEPRFPEQEIPCHGGVLCKSVMDWSVNVIDVQMHARHETQFLMHFYLC